jgi:hypothetical protein
MSEYRAGGVVIPAEPGEGERLMNSLRAALARLERCR